MSNISQMGKFGTTADEKRDAYGTLNQLVLEKDKLTEVYFAVGNIEVARLIIGIVNDSDDENTKIKMWVSKSKEVERANLIESCLNLEPHDNYCNTTIEITRGERLFMQADTDNAIVRISGLEDKL